MFGKQQQNIYDSVALICRQIEYITKIDKSGKCYQQNFIFDKKTAAKHLSEIDKLESAVRNSNEAGCDYAAELAGDIRAFYINQRTDSLSDEDIAHAQIARLALATMSKLHSFNSAMSSEFLKLIKDEKDSINRTISFLASADDKNIFATYARYSDAVTKYIEYLEGSTDACIDSEEDIPISEENEEDIKDTKYEDAKKISELTEQLKALEYKLARTSENADKLEKALSAKERECTDYAAKAARAEKERSMLITDIEAVRREAASSARMKIELPLIILTEPEEEVWKAPNNDGDDGRGNGYKKLLQRISFKQKKSINIPASDNNDISVYSCQVVGSASGLIPCCDSQIVQGFALYEDKSGRHYFIHKSNVNGSKASGRIFDICISQYDELLLTVKYSDDEFNDLCTNNPAVADVLPSFYNFVTEVIKQSMYSGLCNTDAILQFNSYYVHLYMIAKDAVKIRTNTAIMALEIASELKMLLKCFGILEESDAAYMQRIAQMLIDGDNDKIQVPEAGTISANSDIEAYVDNLRQRIMSFPCTEEQPYENDSTECNKAESGGEETSDTLVNIPEPEPGEMPQFKEYTYHAQDSGSKYKRAVVPDLNNVKFIVSKTCNAGEDISLYSVENIESAVSQYCFAIAPVKKIGVSISDKRYYLMQSNNDNKSLRLLDNRTRKFIEADGVLEIVEFYEFKLMNAIHAEEVLK